MSEDLSVILELEKRRCAAINAQDVDGVAALLWDDYTHIHASGQIDHCEAYLGNLMKVPRHTSRGELSVRRYGDVATLLGDQINTFDGKQSTLVVQQIAVLRDDAWKFISAQLTRKVEH